MRKRVLFFSVAIIAVVVFAFAGCGMFGIGGDDGGGDNTTEENDPNDGDNNNDDPIEENDPNDGDNPIEENDAAEDNSITFSGSISDMTARSFNSKDGINAKSETGNLEIVVIYDPQKSW